MTPEPVFRQSEDPESIIRQGLTELMESDVGSPADRRFLAALAALVEERDRLFEKASLAFQRGDLLKEEADRYKAALEQVAGSHRTFGSAQADIRGQHCLDLERIARQALSTPQEEPSE